MRHKYNAQPTTYQGQKFDSKSEANRFKELSLLESIGQISGLIIHPAFELQPAFTDRNGKKHRAIVYEADFSYLDKATQQLVIEDVKGMENRLWLLKKKMFLYRYRDLELRVVK